MSALPAFSPGGIVIRDAVAADAEAIRVLVRAERLIPHGLRWPAFIVAEAGGAIVAAAQVRSHADGSRELASLVVAPAYRGIGLAEALVTMRVSREAGPLYAITRRERAGRYQRHGFHPIRPGVAPAEVRRNYRLASVLGGALSLLRGRRPVALTILRRGPV